MSDKVYRYYYEKTDRSIYSNALEMTLEELLEELSVILTTQRGIKWLNLVVAHNGKITSWLSPVFGTPNEDMISVYYVLGVI